jgi:hypothetical protein
MYEVIEGTAIIRRNYAVWKWETKEIRNPKK